MKHLTKVLIVMLILTASGCATTLPQGPSVTVLPAQGKPFAKFQEEDSDCRKWAEKSTGISPADAQNQSTISGGAIGSALGAGVGALLGSASGHVGAGAAIGAGAGLLVGSSAGSDSGRVSAKEAQRRYDIAYSQCMSSYGNQIRSQAVETVPGYYYYPRRRVIVVPAEQSPLYYAPPPVPVYQAPPLPAMSAPVYPAPGPTAPPPPVYAPAQ